MYQVVAMTMREGAKHGNTIGNALVYEAVRTVTAIYPNPTLLQQGETAVNPASGNNGLAWLLLSPCAVPVHEAVSWSMCKRKSLPQP